MTDNLDTELFYIGYIPQTWSGEGLIYCGDPESSGVNEKLVKIDDCGVVVNDLTIKFNPGWRGDIKAWQELANLIGPEICREGAILTAEKLAASYDFFTDESPLFSDAVIVIEDGEDGSAFENHHGIYNGWFYVHYVNMVDGEAIYEIGIVFKP